MRGNDYIIKETEEITDKLIQGKERIRYHDNNDRSAMATRIKSIGIGNVIQKDVGRSNLPKNRIHNKK